MHCFNHSEIDAVGICKSCGRGLCHNCATEIEKAVACKGRCETEVASMLSINRNALQYAKSTKQARYLGPTLFIVVGALLTTLGLSYDGIDFAVVAGAMVVSIGVAFLIIQHKMAKAIKT